MTELTKIAIELVEMDVVNNLCSKLDGRRNWTIRIEEREDVKVAYVGGYGVMKRRGMLGAFLKSIAKYHIRWFEYTYKKDFKKAVKVLEDNGYIIYNMN